MKSHKLVRLTIVATLLTCGAAGVVATASPADAIGGGCTGGYTQVEDYGVATNGSGQSIAWVDHYEQCNSAPISIDQPDSISKYIAGVGWEVVARGQGYTQYICAGGRYLYTTSAGGPFYCPT